MEDGEDRETTELDTIKSCLDLRGKTVCSIAAKPSHSPQSWNSQGRLGMRQLNRRDIDVAARGQENVSRTPRLDVASLSPGLGIATGA
jgi:hypothetical protein